MKDTLVYKTLLWIICFTVYGLQQLVDSYWTTACLSRSCSSTSSFKEIFDTFSPLKSFPPLPLFSHLGDDLPSATDAYSSWEKSALRTSCFVVQSLSLVLLFCYSMRCSSPWSFVQGISQARMLEWGAISFSTLHHPDPGMLPKSPGFAGGFLTTKPSGRPVLYIYKYVCMYMYICMYMHITYMYMYVCI